MRIALPILCVLTPGLLAWVMGRRLIRLRDDAILPERWLRYRTNVVLSSWIPIGALLYAAPAHALWALPLVLLAAQIGGFPARKVLYEETWSIAEYLGQVLRLLVAWGGFWILLTASPEIVLAAGRYGWLTALALGTILCAWNARYAEVFGRVAGASPLIRPDLHLRFNGILEYTRLPSSPRLLRFGSPRGRLANALALPALRGSMVLCGETLLEVLEPEEITAIFAHEVAHLEYFDLVFLAADAVDKLIAAGAVAPGRFDLVRSPVAVAVKTGAPQPDIGSEDAVKQAVLGARSLSHSTGPSGTHLLKLFERWGIMAQIRHKLVQAAPGVPVGALVARGEVELGFQQLSELMHLDGIAVVGLLPPAIEFITTFSAGLVVQGPRPEAARALLAYLTSPATVAAKRRHGMQPA